MPESLERVLGRIEGKLDELSSDIKDLKKGQERNGGRLDKLERWQAALVGGGAVIGFAVSVLLRLL